MNAGMYRPTNPGRAVVGHCLELTMETGMRLGLLVVSREKGLGIYMYV